MIRFLLGVAVGMVAARAMQQRQGRWFAGSAAADTVGRVDELSTAAAGRAGAAPAGFNAGDGTGGSRPDLQADEVAQEGLAAGRRPSQGGTGPMATSGQRGAPQGNAGSETFNGA
jgi:hypothetical protein